MQGRSNIFFEKPRLVWAGVCHSLASVLVTRAVQKTLKLQNAHFNSWTGYISCKLQFCFLQDQDSKKFHPPYYSQQKIRKVVVRSDIYLTSGTCRQQVPHCCGHDRLTRLRSYCAIHREEGYSKIRVINYHARTGDLNNNNNNKSNLNWLINELITV